MERVTVAIWPRHASSEHGRAYLDRLRLPSWLACSPSGTAGARLIGKFAITNDDIDRGGVRRAVKFVGQDHTAGLQVVIAARLGGRAKADDDQPAG
jgi:hypothetical protein